MKIKVIRPASRQGTDADLMTHSARLTASHTSPGTEVETVFLDVGHHGGSMGGHLNEARIMANAPAVVREVIQAERDGWDVRKLRRWGGRTGFRDDAVGHAAGGSLVAPRRDARADAASVS